MTWVKMSDDFFQRPDVQLLSSDAICLLLAAIAHSNRWLLDGKLTGHDIRLATPSMSPKKRQSALKNLIGVGACTRPKDRDDGLIISWLLDDQPSAAEIAQIRNAAKIRQKRRRLKISEAECHGVTSGVTSDATNSVSHDTPTRPDPSRPYPVQNTDASPLSRSTSLDRACDLVSDHSDRQRRYMSAFLDDWTNRYGAERALAAFEATIGAVKERLARGKVTGQPGAYLGSALTAMSDTLVSGVDLGDRRVDYDEIF